MYQSDGLRHAGRGGRQSDNGCNVRVSIIDESLEEIVREYPGVDPSSKSLVYAFFYLADRLYGDRKSVV